MYYREVYPSFINGQRVSNISLGFITTRDVSLREGFSRGRSKKRTYWLLILFFFFFSSLPGHRANTGEYAEAPASTDVLWLE